MLKNESHENDFALLRTSEFWSCIRLPAAQNSCKFHSQIYGGVMLNICAFVVSLLMTETYGRWVFGLGPINPNSTTHSWLCKQNNEYWITTNNPQQLHAITLKTHLLPSFFATKICPLYNLFDSLINWKRFYVYTHFELNVLNFETWKRMQNLVFLF